MKIMPPQPAGGRATHPAGISTLLTIALLALLVVATSTFAKNRRHAVTQTAGTTTASTVLSIATPPATDSGTVLVASVDVNLASADSIAAPAGWTLVRSDSAQSSTGQLTQAIYLKVVGSAEPSSYGWTFSSAANASGGIAAYSGIDTANPVDSSSGSAVNIRTKTLTAPSVTAAGPGETVVAVFGAGDRSPQPPSGMTQRWRLWAPSAASTVADSVQAAAGATPAVTSIVGKTDLGIAQMITLNHASAAAAPPTPVPPPAPTPPPPPTPLPVASPVNVALPAISGTVTIGGTLSSSQGAWTGAPTSYGYRWQECDTAGSSCADVNGATAATYTVAASDAGSRIRVVVTATNGGGSTDANSNPSVVVAAPPPPVAAPANTAAPAISGSAVQGQTLTASNGAWSGAPTGYAYQWQSCDTSGASCAPLSGATGASFTLPSTVVGKTVRAVVNATNAGGSTSATSAATATVAALPHAASTQPGCTLYVAPNGSAGNTGASQSSPLTIAAANAKSVPGSVICLAAGSYKSGFVQVHSGTAADWVVWRSYNGEPVITWDTSQSRNYMFKVSDGAGYVEFDDITFDGAATAIAAVGCQNHGHHIRVLDSTVLHMGDAGISMVNCDYITVADNTVYRFGDYYGWSSGVSLNWGGGAWWYDQAPGFHNVVARNYIAGGVDNSSYHTDGNGIILDLGGAISPTLIADNVVYMNGGRGIETLKTTGTVYVVNNTLYKNGLDLRMSGIGEGVTNASSNQVWANNAIFAWNPRYTYQQVSGSSGITYRRDHSFGGLGAQNLLSAVLGDPLQFLSTNPMFVNAPAVDANADGQWRNPPTPSALGNGLALQAGSPLVGAGVDPRTLPGLNSSLLAGIGQWAMNAIDGTPRGSGSSFDYGAYQR